MKREHYKNSLFLIIARGFNILVSFLLLPYMVRSLSVQEYGTYGQVILIIEFFRALISMGLAAVIQMQYARLEDKVADIFRTNFIASLILGSGCTLLIIATSPLVVKVFDNDSLYLYMIIYAITMPLYLLKEMFSATHIYLGQARTISINEMIINLVRILLIVISIQVFHSLQYVFVSLTLVNVVSALLFFRKIPPRFKAKSKFDYAYWTEQLRIGIPLGLTAIISTLILTTDGFMISAVMSVEAFAGYKAGAIQVPFVSTLCLDIAATIYPEISKNAQQKKYTEISDLKQKSATFSAILVYPVSCFILAYHQEFIRLYLSEKYAASSIFFLIYNIVLFIRITNNRDILIAFGKTKFILLVSVCVVLINILLNYLLILWLGAAGAAISTLISFYLLAIVFNIASAKLLSVKVFEIFPIRKLSVIFLISASTAAASYLLHYYFQTNVWLLLVNILVFLALTYLLLIRMNIIERSWVNALGRRIPIVNRFFS